MVQRKVPNKLTIQADHVKSERRLKNLGPSSPHHHDGKNRGADMKKKMKKSKSIKRSGFEDLESPILNMEIPQPGKPPPPLDVSAKKATPQKQSDSSPNYMKSTSSFEARKDRSQVSSRRIQTSFDSKSPQKIANSSKLGSVSGHKPVARTSSLKLVRTLTKSPSFKPARNLSKKCSQVVLCDNLEAQRATCSSTLKDSKFPTYLDLSPGATESEGTSVVKVCPYTYCSLNGHQHAPSPPLKCFISARRRTLKTQKSMKLGCLSPRRAKPSGDGLKDIIGQIAFDEKPALQEMDFFIEIYVGDTEDAAEKDDGSKENEGDQNEIDFSVEDSEIGFEDNFDNNSEVIATEMEVAEEIYSPSSTQEEETEELLSNQSDFEVELDGTDLETPDMELEEGQYSALSVDDEVGNSEKPTNELKSCSSFGDDDPSVPREAIFKCDNIDEISADEGLEEFVEEEGASSDSEGFSQNLGIDESIQAHLVSPPCDELEESTTEESDGNADSDDFVATVISLAPTAEDLKTNESPKQELAIADAGNGRDEEEQEDAAKLLIRIPTFEVSEEDNSNNEFELGSMAEDGESNQAFSDEDFAGNQSQTNNVVEDQNRSQKEKDQRFKILDSVDSEDETHSGLNKVSAAENANEDANEMEVEYSSMLEPAEIPLSSGDEAITRAKTAYTRGSKRPVEELESDPNSLRITRCKRPDEELEEEKKFNPQEPNYLSVEPDPEAEKVDLRHQMMDERRNSEEWMIDYALQQAVTKLAPARKRKVALLVEAFENVMPIPKYESRLRHTPAAAFAHARLMQACS
ncbi:calmodulin binding protein PICBP-like [Actinidia eriantha]|uniref:calmodulin binding protein PICBP-like n=1 Tax=Actinidia eriantha TaxID=165200 RepID=UPI002583AFB7|nr:calmodulin binding protein PICBP-like [Actinidia eriantha]XP_057513435.1 calmodulin binding protein PICBP-like [Actinidia eriantha]